MTREHSQSAGRERTGSAFHTTVDESCPQQGDSLSRHDTPEHPLERASFNVHIAVADFVIAARLAQDPESAAHIAAMIEPLLLALRAAQDSAVGRSQVLKRLGR